MSELGAVSLWRFREKIEFGQVGRYENSNGIPGFGFKPMFSKKAARYRISTRMLLGNSGLDIERDKVFAIRHISDKELTAYKARWNGKIYNVTEYLPDDSKPVTCDLITLRLSEKNG